MARTLAALIFAAIAVGSLLATEIKERKIYNKANELKINNIEPNEAHHFISKQTDNIISRKAGPKCKAKDICIIMGGACVINATLCVGRLVPGCKGKNCKCCVAGTLDTKMNNLGEKLEKLNIDIKTLKDNLTDANSNLSDELQIWKDNLTEANSNLSNELQTLEDNLSKKLQILKYNLTDTNLNLSNELQNLRDNLTDANLNLSNELQTLKDNLTDNNSNLSSVIQTLKDNLAVTNSNLNNKLQNLKDNITDANSNFSNDLQTLKDNLTIANSEFSKEFQSMRDNLNSLSQNLYKQNISMKGCPESFFQTAGSSQCYKFYNDTRLGWTDAIAKCRTEGLVLAEPVNPLSLRKYIAETYDVGTYAHLGGRGDGTSFRWERSGKKISNTDPLWWPGEPGPYVQTNICLYLMIERAYLDNRPYQVYARNGCNIKYHIVCEYVKE